MNYEQQCTELETKINVIRIECVWLIVLHQVTCRLRYGAPTGPAPIQFGVGVR